MTQSLFMRDEKTQFLAADFIKAAADSNVLFRQQEDALRKRLLNANPDSSADHIHITRVPKPNGYLLRATLYGSRTD